MVIYHGSKEQVIKPEIRKASRSLDYGNDFYTTTSEKQATLWVKRKMRKQGGKGYVNLYEFDKTACPHLNILHFEDPTEEWPDFVMANRMN